MTGCRPHAFQRRDWFTCDTCLCCEWRGLERWCAHNQRVIRWDATSFGCGEYFAKWDRKPLYTKPKPDYTPEGSSNYRKY